MSIRSIKKRDGAIVTFDASKIKNAILKSFIAVARGDDPEAGRIAQEVTRIVEEAFQDKTPTVEDIQNLIEDVLIKYGHNQAAKAYILYRAKRNEVRSAKKFVGVKDDLKLSVNATRVLQRRYLIRNEEANVIETPSEMFRRVSRTICAPDQNYIKEAGGINQTEEKFYEIMARLEFLPNSPTLMNAGTDLGQLSACFVLPVNDSIDEIFNALKYMALIHKSGGGTGFSFSHLRPKGDLVKTTMGVASGPISFMRIFDVATEVVKQGGRRRGANMGILRIDHPDILDFITSKDQERILSNFNISVGITDEFMEKTATNEAYDLINPRTKEAVGKLKAKDVFELIATAAWHCGDPGMIFLDEINRHNPTPEVGLMEGTNPCGEVPLLPYESCNLGSINLRQMVMNKTINWDRLGQVTEIAVHFLDNVIDANHYLLPQIETMTKANRKIGLGVMGFADMLLKLEIPYDSEEALIMAEKVMDFIHRRAHQTSCQLGLKRGSFPNFAQSMYARKFDTMRNATVTTIAPTGTLSIIANTSSGIEPNFAISYVRDVMEGTRLLEVNPVFESLAREKAFYSEDLMMTIARQGSIRGLEELSDEIKRIFVTALDVQPIRHVKMQAAFQKYTDNAVAKTVNLPKEASLDEVKEIFWLAYKLKCKGITVYRYGSKQEQVLYIGSVLKKETGEDYIRVHAEYSGGCADKLCPT